ncbi:MAG TPA: DNA repair protein RecO [Candidatus Limnocylindria bacterium]|nr:DNA repair protein RecO [Candidatus Limnocylindria bacterium]
MSRETKLTAIILKKQPFKEGDEIITLFTKEQGKVRVLAKSVKSAKSKLQQKLQALFLVEMIVTTGEFPKIIGVEALQVYHHLRENLQAMKMAFYAIELVLKITVDEQPNENLFNSLKNFLEFLDAEKQQEILNLGLAKFKIEILEVSGLGMQSQKNELFLKLKQTDFTGLQNINPVGLKELQDSLSQFIEYQLERKVKSERYLNQ